MRTLKADFINEVANHPEVHKWMGLPKSFDATPLVSNPYNYTFVNEGGGFVLVQHVEGVYEVHSLFLPDKRQNVVTFMDECFDFMFTNTNCIEVRTQLPDDNVAALGLAKKARFVPMFRRDTDVRGPTTYSRVHIDDWIQNNEALEKEGRWFHEKLHEALGEANHSPDPSHERAVGSVVKMIKVGNCAKAVDTYNRWATFAGYAPITLVNDVPPVIDVVDAVVTWNGKDMEILECR